MENHLPKQSADCIAGCADTAIPAVGFLVAYPCGARGFGKEFLILVFRPVSAPGAAAVRRLRSEAPRGGWVCGGRPGGFSLGSQRLLEKAGENFNFL